MPAALPSDDALDSHALTRCALMGADASVLPVHDPSAPIDLTRLLDNARATLRVDVVAANDASDAQVHVPASYPSPFGAWTEADR